MKKISTYKSLFTKHYALRTTPHPLHITPYALFLTLVLAWFPAGASVDPVPIMAGLKKDVIAKLNYEHELLNDMEYRITGHHFVDIKLDGRAELVFWSEGIAPHAWERQEFIAVAEQEEDESWHLAAFKIISPSIKCDEPEQCRYSYRSFTPSPLTPNHFIGGTFTYADYGVSGHVFYTEVIGFNRYEDTFYINTVASPVPLVPDVKYK